MEGFGGFTVNPWQSNDRGEYSTSNGDKAWLFSLNNTTGHPIRLKCIRHCNVQGHDLCIGDHPNLDNNSVSDLGYAYVTPVGEFGSEEAQSFLAGSKSFTVAEWEVFQAVPL